jgi:hypothetical protein
MDFWLIAYFGVGGGTWMTAMVTLQGGREIDAAPCLEMACDGNVGFRIECGRVGCGPQVGASRVTKEDAVRVIRDTL